MQRLFGYLLGALMWVGFIAYIAGFWYVMGRLSWHILQLVFAGG